MSGEINHLYRFGEFCVDGRERVLRRDGKALALPPKVFDTLLLLVSRQGSIVSKTELMEAVWPETFVEESNLTQNIYTLRRVLGTDEHGNNFIENVPRRGYRFSAALSFDDVATKPAEAIQTVPTGLQSPAGKTETPRPARNVQRLSSRLLRFGFVLISIGVLGGVVAYFVSARNDKHQFTAVENVRFERLTFSGDLSFPVIAPDGKSFAFIQDNQIVVQDLATGDQMRLSVEGESVYGILQFSTNGESIYFRDRVDFDHAANIYRVSRFGGRSQLVAEDVWSGFGFSPDGKQLAFVRADPKEAKSVLIVKDLAAGTERQLSVLNSPSIFLDNGHPAWSTDGNKIAVVIFKRTPGSPVSQLALADVENGTLTEVSNSQLWQFEQVAWLPGSEELIVSARENGKFFQLWRLNCSTGQVERVTNDLNIYRGVSLSGDGKKLLARQFTLYSHLWTGGKSNPQDVRQKTFGNLNRDGMAGLNWAPNGDLVYVARIMGNYDIWTYTPADDSRRQLTKNAGELNRNPVVSNDGKYIFFDSNRTGAHHIWRMDANGENQTQITFGENEVELCPQLSPDGRWLYYIRRDASSSAIWRHSLVNGRAEALTSAGSLAPNSSLAVSPDGNFLAFQNSTDRTDDNGSDHLYRVGVIRTDVREDPTYYSIQASRLMVRWSGDSASIDFIENRPEGARIWRQQLDRGQAPAMIVDLPEAFLHNFAWSADGERLVLSRGKQMNDAILLTNFRP